GEVIRHPERAPAGAGPLCPQRARHGGGGTLPRSPPLEHRVGSRRPSPRFVTHAPRSRVAAAPDRWRRALCYVRLTKPRVIELLRVTTVPSMILADGGFPSVGLLVVVLVGGTLAAGGANTVNCWIERERDVVMRR